MLKFGVIYGIIYFVFVQIFEDLENFRLIYNNWIWHTDKCVIVLNNSEITN